MERRYLYIVFLLLPLVQTQSTIRGEDVQKVIEIWSREIGEKLFALSMIMTRKEEITRALKPLERNIYTENGATLIENVALKMRELMQRKVEAVTRIADYAEFLAYHRPTDYLKTDGDFQFYHNISDTKYDLEREKELEFYVREAECEWWCIQRDLYPLTNNIFDKAAIEKLFIFKPNGDDLGIECNCNSLSDRSRSPEYFKVLPMKYAPEYGYDVNFNISIVKVATNIYHRDQEVLQGVRWSEPLDMVFKDNLLRDPTLKYQYFASPVGYMRHFPAVQWSKEKYDETYDFRTRSWYTEAMTSPKDIIILLDVSGSMHGVRKQLAHHIINNILDTLNDNDFVNIYVFSNKSEPLVECFGETLVQANEENLRLLRESLDTYNEQFTGDLSLGVEKAFATLKRFREERLSSQCNQAIMLITEGIDYDYKPELFNISNKQVGTPVRVFTFVLETEKYDAQQMEWMACDNRGYFVNVSFMSEIREKVLNYVNVMSRPVNLKSSYKQVPIWSYLQIDLADRRYSNWLWKKFEGNRQRQVFLDHVKRLYQRLGQVLTSKDHMLLQESHDYQKYDGRKDFDYMMTLSLPVYGRRDQDVDLIGVSAVDVPIKLLKSLVPHHKLGVNGYAFILTNNGYILMHPGHRREFENIPKPTFNRVDLLEVEILEDKTEPRLFGEKIVKLRERMVKDQRGSDGYMKVKFAIDDMKRIILGKRRYYYTPIGPFTLGIALPDKYGLMIVNNTEHRLEFHEALEESRSWAVHPEWIYCQHNRETDPKSKVFSCLNDPSKCKTDEQYMTSESSECVKICCTDSSEELLRMLKAPGGNQAADAQYETTVKWSYWVKKFTKEFKNLYRYLRRLSDYEDSDAEIKVLEEHKLVKDYFVATTFVATHSGLTRWKTFSNIDDYDNIFEGDVPQIHAINEDWYKRAVEENYKDEEENTFIYAVPFEISGYENNTMVTSTNAIFVEDSERRTPVAVVGLQFNHRAMETIYRNITRKCYGYECITCKTEFLECFILDNNAYVIFSDEVEYTGRFIGDIKPDLMYHLVKNKVYKPVRMFDYQAICQKLPPEPKKKKSSAARITRTIFKTIQQFLQKIARFSLMTMTTILSLTWSILAGPNYQSIKEDTLAFERLEIKKTLPTPCDHEMHLFTWGERFNSSKPFNINTKYDCKWPYMVQRIPKSNLIFMAVNGLCKMDTSQTYHKTPTPREIVYNDSLPCYIANKNKFSRRVYTSCYDRSYKEDVLYNTSRYYCGHTWT